MASPSTLMYPALLSMLNLLNSAAHVALRSCGCVLHGCGPGLVAAAAAELDWLVYRRVLHPRKFGVLTRSCNLMHHESTIQRETAWSHAYHFCLEIKFERIDDELDRT